MSLPTLSRVFRRHGRLGGLFLVVPLLLILLLSSYYSFQKQIDSDISKISTARSYVELETVPAGWNRAHIFESIAQQAEQKQVNVYLQAQAGALARNIYIFPGARERIPGDLENGYYSGGFVPEYTTVLKPWQSLETSIIPPTGIYSIDGSSEQGRMFSEALAQMGLINKYAALPISWGVPVVESRQLDIALIGLSFLTIAGGAFYRAVQRWRIVALRLVGGWPLWRIWAREYWALLITLIVTAVIFIGLVMLALWAYNGGFRLAQVLAPLGSLALLTVILVLIVQTLALLPTAFSQLGLILKGKQPRLVLAIFLTLAQILGFIFITGFTSQAIIFASPPTDTKQQEALFQAYSGFYSVSSLGAKGEIITAETVALSRQFIEAAIKQKQVTVSTLGGYSLRALPSQAGVSKQYHKVNQAYLEHFPIFKTDSTRFQGDEAPAGTKIVGIPTDFNPGYTSALLASLGVSSASKVQIVELRPHQTFAAPLYSVPEPMPMVLSTAQETLDEYQPYLGNLGWALFRDYDQLQELLRSSGYAPYASISPVGIWPPIAQPFLSQDQVWIGFSLVIALISSLIVTAVYAEKNRRRLFAQAIFGWGFWHRHRKYLLFISVLGALSLLYMGSSYSVSVFTDIRSGIETTYSRWLLGLILSTLILVSLTGFSYLYLWLRGRKLLLEDLKNP